MTDKVEVMSPEKLWELCGDADVEQFRGETQERTAYDHKLAKDMEIFGKLISEKQSVDNVVHVYNGQDLEDEDDEEFFDVVGITRQ